ncbi:hypothetical protein TanjilG_03499 [Lupinus angustifolius]|uniref:Protein BIG GRAIN 1-like B n=1 Tax=Lupinus angustifolius TaxID=3871 RepID=A0A1J7IVR9_LUPAN|nr:PREDICTED: protein BIG GRAIN 1-like C [Lupinus angustifolius]OIW19365.1 hypothetical protein TanjilG_03499 [Lupinus angustifolius]
MHRREREGLCPQRRRTPSFSSTLLDTIYRSIDESKTDLDQDQQVGHYNKPSKNINFSNKYNHGIHNSEKSGKERMNLRQAVMLEDWMEKQNSHSSYLLNPSSSSSECSSAGMFSFSSSETDSSNNKQRSKTKSEKPQMKQQQQQQQQQQKAQEEGGFARTKLRAMKIYGDLNQKVKQPISPGSKIACFLSSIFNSYNVKKAKMCYVGAVEDVTFEHKSKSPCFSSTPSSFSTRSCMTKTPSSAKRNKSNNNGIKRSVRFYPVSVILGEDSETDPSLMPLSNVRKDPRRSSTNDLKNTTMAKEKGYKNSSGKCNFDFSDFYDNGEEEEDEEDDALSYSSSDLFELDHLIGAERFQQELPVYETTNLETNKAIAIGLHL